MDEIKIGAEQEIYLAPETEKIRNAEEVAKISLDVEKYHLIIGYDANEKDNIITELEKLGCDEIKQLDFANCVAVSMSMAQLKAIKTLNGVERVEKDYDYKCLINGVSESEYSSYLAGVNSRFNSKKEVKLAVFDTGVTNVSVNGSVNFVNDSTGDENGHGTQMAGIISSVVTNEENKVASPSIYSVIVADHRGFAKTSTIMQALDWAIHNGIKIINMSFGDYHKSALLEEMINRVSNYGIVMVAAAGNDGAFKDESRIMYPAAFTNVLSVGAKNGETVAAYSNGGIGADCFASGTQILEDANGNQVSVIGTSGAAAFVAGTILKNWCISPEKSASDIITDIKTEMAITAGRDAAEILTVVAGNDMLSKTEDADVSVASDSTVNAMNDTVSALCVDGDGGCSSNDMASAISLPFLFWRSGSIDCPGNEVWYKFTANANGVHPNGSPGWYTVHTQGSLDTVGYLYDSYGNQIAYCDDHGGDLNFYFWAQLDFGETYYIRVKAYGNNTGDFSVRVSYYDDDHGNTMDSATEVVGVYYQDKSVTGYLHSQNDVDYYAFVPARNCVMEIYTEGDTDTYGQLYCASGGLLDSDNNSNGNGNFKITAHLEAMKRYYIAVSHNSSTGYGDYTLRFKFVKDYYYIPNEYYSNQVKPIIAWYNNSYTESPSYPDFTSVKYHMYMNKSSALLWRDNFLTNKPLVTALNEAISNNLPSEIDYILHNAGLQLIDVEEVLVSIIAECIVKLITPYIDRAFFESEYDNMSNSELMYILYYTACLVEDSGGLLPNYRYIDAYNYNTTNGNKVYGEPYLRGEWGAINLG